MLQCSQLMKGSVWLTRAFTSGGGSGIAYGFPDVFLHVTHFLMIVLILWRADGIQYFWRMAVSVALTPPCSCATWAFLMTSVVMVCREGRSYGNFANSERGALWMRPPHLSSPSWSINSLNCLTNDKRRRLLDVRLLISSPNVVCWTWWTHWRLDCASSDTVSGPVSLDEGSCLLLWRNRRT